MVLEYLAELPEDVWLTIVQRLNVSDAAQLNATCRSLHHILASDNFRAPWLLMPLCPQIQRVLESRADLQLHWFMTWGVARRIFLQSAACELGEVELLATTLLAARHNRNWSLVAVDMLRIRPQSSTQTSSLCSKCLTSAPSSFETFPHQAQVEPTREQRHDSAFRTADQEQRCARCQQNFVSSSANAYLRNRATSS
eukprot:CAMPEP_0185839400 /NCGR_PEP_ID=MMETSP1353-20130828/14529_1 /TAXON_ID=1077150 /ORGANISM="Erythrolobus australicus, Strain CCMP3124" /LENGTH=196 /DNA_ID=CAMNT_0028538555 /DNA_START=1087 /DNA_END=1674 /DNA_ORIENTATION=+